MCLSSLAEARNNGEVKQFIPKDRTIEVRREPNRVKATVWSDGFFAGGFTADTPEELISKVQHLINQDFKLWAETSVGCAELGHSSLSLAAEIVERVEVI